MTSVALASVRQAREALQGRQALLWRPSWLSPANVSLRDGDGVWWQEIIGPMPAKCHFPKKTTHTDTPYTPHPTKLRARASCMLSQEAAKKGKDAMLNEHKRHQIELNSMRQSSRKQHQKLKELLPALLAPWPQHCCRRRDLERAYRNKAASLHPDKRGCHEAFCGLHSCAWPAFRRQGQGGARDWSRSQLVRVLCPLPPISTTAWMWCTVARCWLGPGARAGLPRIKAVKGLGSWKALTAGSFQRSAATSSLTRWNAAWQFSETGCSISACLSMRTLGHALQNEYVNIASYKMAVAFLLSRARPTLQPPSNHLHPDHVEFCHDCMEKSFKQTRAWRLKKTIGASVS